jgi:tRNA modification GTPase
MQKETIVGQATANGPSALNIIRVSGDDAIDLVNQLFQGKDLLTLPAQTVTYGHIVDQHTVVDEVMVSVFRHPFSYTRENMVEISCHGGFFVASEIIRLLIKSGARMADPGEFTLRAYLHGRIDLSEAESIMDVINAKTKDQLRLAQMGLRGDVKRQVVELQKQLLQIIAEIEVNIDYPEYDDVVQVTNALLKPKIESLRDKILEHIQSSRTGKIIREGIKAVIIGKPNVGKSSLLNSLIGEEKAIVTEISGTTRDLVEAELNLNGIYLHLIDTAGIRDTTDIVEKIGIERAKKAVDDADLVLLVLDQSASLTELDEQLLALTQSKKRILVGNKIDLGSHVDILSEKIINVSAKNRIGMDQLAKEVQTLFWGNQPFNAESALFANARHIGALEAAQVALDAALSAVDQGLPVDMVEIDLRNAWSEIGEITGDTASESLVDTLFSSFCLGK